MTMAKTTVTRWWLIRHAPVVGTHGRVYGQMDVGCDVSDTASFKALAARVPDDALWFTTPLSRTLRTAEALGEQIRAAGRPAPPDPVVDAAFIEQSFGAWQGLTYREIGAYGQTETAHRFWLAPAVETPPGGESFAMNGAEVLDIGRSALWLTIQLAAPMLIVGLVVGVVIGLFQALTQIQEATLVFAPKIVAVFVSLLIFLPIMGALMSGFMAQIAGRIAAM